MWKNILVLLQTPSFWFGWLGLFLLKLVWTRRKLYLLSWQMYGPWSLPLVGNLLNLCRVKRSNLLLFMFRNYIFKSPNRLARMWLGTELWVFVGDASVAAQVNRVVEKPKLLECLGGGRAKGGLATATTQQEWKRARSIAVPAFHVKYFSSMVPTFHEESLKSVAAFEKMSATGEKCNNLRITTLYSASTALKNFDLYVDDRQMLVIADHVGYVFDHFQNRMLMPLYKNYFIYWLAGFLQDERRSVQILKDQIVAGVEASALRMKTGSGADSGRNSFVRAAANVFEDVNNEEVYIQAANILMASTDTTAVQNFAVLLMLALNPAVQSKLYEEVTAGLGHDMTVAPSYEDILKLDYLDRVIKETMRIYPAAVVTAKQIKEDMKIAAEDGEYTLPAGTSVAIFIMAIHRNPKYYESPWVFDPDRFLPERVAQRHPHCFVSFSSGPRKCIAGRYAVLQMKVFVANMVRAFEISPGDRCRTMDEVAVETAGTIKFKENCEIRMKRRTERVR